MRATGQCEQRGGAEADGGGSDPIRFPDVVTSGPAYHYPLEDEIRLINSIKAGNEADAGAILESIHAANFAQARL